MSSPLTPPAGYQPAAVLAVPAPGVASDLTVGTANANAVVSYAAVVGQSNTISGVIWSYNGTPTGGRLTIQDGSATVRDIDITAAGPGEIVFPYPLQGTVGNAMTITLYAGGSGVVGKVQAANAWLGTVPASATPILRSAAISANGLTLTLTFSLPIFSSSTSGGFTLTTGQSGTPSVTYASGLGTTTLTYTLGSPVVVNDTASLAYAGGILPSPVAFSGFAVTNGSTVV